MSKPVKIYLMVLIAAIFLCCENEHDDKFIEQQIFSRLLPQLVDSIYKDPAVYLNFQEASKYARADSIPKQTDKRQKTQKKIPVAIDENLNPAYAEDTTSLQQIIAMNKLDIKPSPDKAVHKIVFPPYNNQKYLFRYFSESQEKENAIYTNGQSTFRISVYFSRIWFSKNKDFGIFTATYKCHPRCGIGYVIIVQKAAVAWRIYKVYDTWVS